MAQTIVSVDAGSPAARAGIRAGDELLRINGECVVDLLDYEALCAEARLRLALRREGKTWERTVEKDEYESLGLNFATPLMSGMRLCCNFGFYLPKLREERDLAKRRRKLYRGKHEGNRIRGIPKSEKDGQ